MSKKLDITINLIGWRRPRYFKQVIDSLEECHGVEGYSFLVCIDGGYPDRQAEQKEIFLNSSLSTLKHEVHMHDENMGCAANAGFAFNKTFRKGCDAVITLEDDTVPSKDFLVFMEWGLSRFKDDRDIFSVTGHMPRFKSEFGDDEGVKNAFRKDKGFGCHGWGTWKRIYDEIGTNWFGIRWKQGGLETNYQVHGSEFLEVVDIDPKGSWAWPMNRFWRRDRYQVMPDVSRILNIGVEEGTFRTDEEVTVDYWSENHADRNLYRDFILYP